MTDWLNSRLAKLYYTPEGRTISEKIWKEAMEELKFANVDDIIKSMM